jgi:hypothetical protein
MNLSEYRDNYGRRHKLYWARGIPWRRYKGILRPLSLPHLELNVERRDTRRLLRESRCPFAMWSYEFDSGQSEWWWVIAEKPYRLENLSGKARYNIRNGLKHCKAEVISAQHLADIGYECYRSAVRRHKQTEPLSETEFRARVPGYDTTGAHEVWGVFTEGGLAGYATYLLIEDVVSQLEAFFDPAYFRVHSSHALLHTITDHYLNQRNCAYITTGMRSISHETQFEDFVIRTFGYRKAYCKLGLEYAPSVRVLAGLVHQTSPIWKRLHLPPRLKNRLDIIDRLKRVEKWHADVSQSRLLDSTG